LQVNSRIIYCCRSTAVSVATAGQLLSKLLMHVQLLSKLLQVKLLLKVNLCLSYSSRSPSCVRVTSTDQAFVSYFRGSTHVAVFAGGQLVLLSAPPRLLRCQIVNVSLSYPSMVKRYPDFCCMQVNSCLIYCCLSTFFLVGFCLSYTCRFNLVPLLLYSISTSVSVANC